MKAAEIARIYRAAAPVFGNRPSAWLLLVLICAAGEAGMTVNDLCNLLQQKSRDSRQSTLRRWHKAGLLNRAEIPATCHDGRKRGGRNQVVYSATPKAFQLLRLSEG